jgi:hypothetical protein
MAFDNHEGDMVVPVSINVKAALIVSFVSCQFLVQSGAQLGETHADSYRSDAIIADDPNIGGRGLGD